MNVEVRKPTEQEIKDSESWATWSKEVSQFDWEYEDQETCYILSGSAEVSCNNGETVHFKEGDWVVFSQGLKCEWKIHEDIEKRYLFGN